VPQGYINSLNKTFQQAVAEGIGVFVSSGDSGDEISNTGIAQPDFYANSPFVTAVGGTSASIVPKGAATGGTVTDSSSAITNAANWTREFEVGWQTSLDNITTSTGIVPTTNDSLTYTLNGTLPALPGTYTSGAGGGVSRVFALPSYQKAAGITTSGRAVPDIAALADPNTGFLVGQTQQFPEGNHYDEYRIGGTSLAAPLMAGMAADANEKAGSPLGFLNPRIYGVYNKGAGSSLTGAAPLYDVDQNDAFCGGDGCTTADPLPAVLRVNYADNLSAANGRTYSIRTQETPLTTLHTVRDYDQSTGVGTPQGTPFLLALAGK
jgi:subtilase family serine protease